MYDPSVHAPVSASLTNEPIRLHDINLRRNRLSSLPDEMGALVGLNSLNLAHNCLERRLTDHLGLLTRLTDLDMSSNEIGHLPPSLGALEVRGRNSDTVLLLCFGVTGREQQKCQLPCLTL